jgi:hypothetical protein
VYDFLPPRSCQRSLRRLTEPREATSSPIPAASAMSVCGPGIRRSRRQPSNGRAAHCARWTVAGPRHNADAAEIDHAGGERVALVCYSRGLARWFERQTLTWPAKERPAYVGLFHRLPMEWGAEKGADDDNATGRHRSTSRRSSSTRTSATPRRLPSCSAVCLGRSSSRVGWPGRGRSRLPFAESQLASWRSGTRTARSHQ